MHEIPSWTQLTQMGIEKKARELAWNSFSKEEQEAFLVKAKVLYNKEISDLAIKCYEEAEAAFNAPGFVSRADPRAYDLPKIKSKKKK